MSPLSLEMHAGLLGFKSKAPETTLCGSVGVSNVVRGVICIVGGAISDAMVDKKCVDGGCFGLMWLVAVGK